MKKYLLSLLIILAISVHGQDKQGNTALLLIDIQEFYFPGGAMELSEPVKAADNATRLLQHFREQEKVVIHVRHIVKAGGDIYKGVLPQDGEMVISKDDVNCFKDTELLEFLKSNNVTDLVICGMQTHMCVEAATRAASDFNFNCTLIGDACATRNLVYENHTTEAKDVHYSSLTTLQSYAEVTDTDTFLNTQK